MDKSVILDELVNLMFLSSQEHFQSEGDLNKSLELLGELKDSPYWTDACFRVVSHCVQHEDLRFSLLDFSFS